jgi:hypothetical protein
MLNNRSRTLVVAVLGLSLTLALGSTARAGYIVNVIESGGNVVATGSGTIDTAGLQFVGNGGNFYAMFIPTAGDVILGPTFNNLFVDFYSGISGPTSFGTGARYDADSGSGALIGILSGDFIVPDQYVSGTFLSSTDTWTGQTFATLGLTPGTYVWTWGSGANADSFTMNIGGSSVPEPASIMMVGIGTLGLLGYGRLRRKKAVA